MFASVPMLIDLDLSTRFTQNQMVPGIFSSAFQVRSVSRAWEGWNTWPICWLEVIPGSG